MHTKDTVAKLVKKQQTISKRGLSAQYENTEACESFYNGDQMTYTDQIQFADTAGRRRRAMVNFNKVQSNVDAVVGFMAQNRRQAKFIARLNVDQGQELYSKNMNAIHSFHRENMNADQLETDQDADMMINGYGAMDTDLSYIIGNATTDPNGEVIKAKLEPRRVGWDPAARGKNLLDARWAYYYDDYELKDALDLFQGSTKSDFEQVSDEDTGDTGYVYNPWGGLYDKIKMHDDVEWAAKEQEMVRVYNHQWMEYETVYKAENPIYLTDNVDDAMYMRIRLELIAAQIKPEGPEGLDAGDMFDFDPLAQEFTFNESTRRLLVKEFGDLITPIAFKRKCFYTAVVSGSHVFTFFKSVCQQGFSIKFKTGVFNKTNGIWVGMVNSMMEPQKYYNKALTELMFTIAANSKGGVMVEEDAVSDIADFEKKWAKTDAVIKVRTGALAGGKIQEKTRGAVPTGLENIIQLSDAAIASNGVDPAFLGQMDPDSQQSGILFKRRVRQVISKMARYFDSIALYQKEDARLCADLYRVWIQNNNGQWVRITGPEFADEFMQISEDMLAPEYDVSIQEAPQTPEDKQETAALLGAYGDKLALTNPAAASTCYAESINMLSLDGDVRSRIMKTLQPQDSVPMEQFQELQQQLDALKSQLAQAEAAKVQSEVALNQAKAVRESALTAESLEKAANTGLENDIIRSGGYSEAKVSI